MKPKTRYPTDPFGVVLDKRSKTKLDTRTLVEELITRSFELKNLLEHGPTNGFPPSFKRTFEEGIEAALIQIRAVLKEAHERWDEGGR